MYLNKTVEGGGRGRLGGRQGNTGARLRGAGRMGWGEGGRKRVVLFFCLFF